MQGLRQATLDSRLRGNDEEGGVVREGEPQADQPTAGAPQRSKGIGAEDVAADAATQKEWQG